MKLVKIFSAGIIAMANGDPKKLREPYRDVGQIIEGTAAAWEKKLDQADVKPPEYKIIDRARS